MAAAATFAVTPRFAAVSLTTAMTSRENSATPTNIMASGSNGTLFDRLTAKATQDMSDAVLTVFIFDGTNHWLVDEIDLGNPAAVSNTAAGPNFVLPLNFILPPAHNIRAAITVAPTAGAMHVMVFARDF